MSFDKFDTCLTTFTSYPQSIVLDAPSFQSISSPSIFSDCPIPVSSLAPWVSACPDLKNDDGEGFKYVDTHALTFPSNSWCNFVAIDTSFFDVQQNYTLNLYYYSDMNITFNQATSECATLSYSLKYAYNNDTQNSSSVLPEFMSFNSTNPSLSLTQVNTNHIGVYLLLLKVTSNLGSTETTQFFISVV